MSSRSDCSTPEECPEERPDPPPLLLLLHSFYIIAYFMSSRRATQIWRKQPKIEAFAEKQIQKVLSTRKAPTRQNLDVFGTILIWSPGGTSLYDVRYTSQRRRYLITRQIPAAQHCASWHCAETEVTAHAQRIVKKFWILLLRRRYLWIYGEYFWQFVC